MVHNAVLPGGNAKSAAKKARLQTLSQTLAGGQASTAGLRTSPPSQGPLAKKARKGGTAQQQAPSSSWQPTKLKAPHSPHHTSKPGKVSAPLARPANSSNAAAQSHAQALTNGPSNMEVGLQGNGALVEGLQIRGNARAGEPPYNTLDESIAKGPLARVLEARPTSKPGLGGGGSALDSLIEVLLRTNPALRGNADARAVAGLRVQDKSILLDNPPGAKQARAHGARQPPGYAKQLISKRKAPVPALLKQGAVRYMQVLPLHHLWQRYISSQLDHVLPPASQLSHPQQPSSQQQQQNKQEQQHKRRQRQQQQQSNQPQPLNTHTPPTNPISLAPAPSPTSDISASQSPLSMRQLSAVHVAAARLQLSRCELHGSALQVVSCPSPQYVGIKGVVAQITARAVCVVDAGDWLHVVPKKGTAFACDLSLFGLPWAAVYKGQDM